MFDDIGDSLQGSGVQFHPPMGSSPEQVTIAETPKPAPKPRAPRKPKAAAPIVDEAKPRARAAAKPKPAASKPKVAKA